MRPGPRALVLVLTAALASACRKRRATAACARSVAVAPAPRTLAGLYWARIAEVPDGMRVQLWLDHDGARVRGAYTALPWNGELEGHVQPDGALAVALHERGVTLAVGARERTAVLRWDALQMRLRGRDDTGRAIELYRAHTGPSLLAPGVWLARWTGLPSGMAVETRVARDPDGHFRAAYQYQGAGGVRDGSFDGVSAPDGVLSLAWTELSSAGALARGTARLAPVPGGLRGAFGIEGGGAALGEWSLELLAGERE